VIDKSVRPGEVVKIFIGFDQVEAVAYHVLSHSIISRASVPVAIYPVKRSMLKAIHDRPIDDKQSNEFSFTRFLVPYLSGYKGVSIFMDCDMLVRCDIKELIDQVDLFGTAVSVVKHQYTPRDEIKYLGTVQYKYERKNWSSVIVFNNSHSACKRLTPEYVNTASGLELHQFKWCKDEQIGELGPEWNHLVSEYPPNPDAKIVHYTVGTPCFNEFRNCEFGDEWYEERQLMLHALQIEDIEIVV